MTEPTDVTVVDPGDGVTVDLTDSRSRTPAGAVKPRDLGVKLRQLVDGVLEGFSDDGWPAHDGGQLAEMTLGVTVDAKADLKIVSASASASLLLRFVPGESP